MGLYGHGHPGGPSCGGVVVHRRRGKAGWCGGGGEGSVECVDGGGHAGGGGGGAVGGGAAATDDVVEDEEHLVGGLEDLVARGERVVGCGLPGEFGEERDHRFVGPVLAFEGVCGLWVG